MKDDVARGGVTRMTSGAAIALGSGRRTFSSRSNNSFVLARRSSKSSCTRVPVWARSKREVLDLSSSHSGRPLTSPDIVLPCAAQAVGTGDRFPCTDHHVTGAVLACRDAFCQDHGKAGLDNAVGRVLKPTGQSFAITDRCQFGCQPPRSAGREKPRAPCSTSPSVICDRSRMRNVVEEELTRAVPHECECQEAKQREHWRAPLIQCGRPHLAHPRRLGVELSRNPASARYDRNTFATSGLSY